MWKYIVTWIVVSFVQIPCPDTEMKNEFGQKSSYSTSCAVYHVEVIRSDHSKHSFNRDSIFEFYKRAKLRENKFGEGLDSVKIDSVYIK